MSRDIAALKEKSRWLRSELFDLVMGCKRGHIPSSFSIVEFVVALFYGGIMRVNPKEPRWKDRDRLFISKGHAAMAVYPVLVDLGFLPASELQRFTKPDGMLRMYADHMIPGIEAPCGSLGHGFGIAAGMAWTGKKDGRPFKSYCVVGDGECYEGSIWEAAMFAAHHKLDNLIAIVDRNYLCTMDNTERCIHLDPMAEKWKAFGWNVVEADGHSYRSIFAAFDQIAAQAEGRPSAIISRSVKGKGISYMENQANWHNKMPSAEQIAQGKKELQAQCIVD